MDLKQQLDIQRMYSRKIEDAKTPLDKKEDVIDDLKRKLRIATKKDIIVSDKNRK